MKHLKLLSVFLLLAFFSMNCNSEGNEMSEKKTVYNFTAKNIDGEDVNLSEYKGKVLLIVNTASECGFTSQYEGLQEIFAKYKDQGFEVLAFPCNQFGGQEPGEGKDIKEFCSTKFSTTFPLFDKIDVNGENAHPLYKFLKSEQTGLVTDDIKWNFTKFLIGKDGVPISRYAPQTTPANIAPDIEKALNS
jgi:glutathione peroxidase